MRVLNTRPEMEAVALDQRLEELGHTSIPCPLLAIRPRPGAQVDLAGVQAIAMTSAAAVRAIAALDPARDLPVYAVGKATADVASSLGYRHVAVGGGDVQALGGRMIQDLDPAAGTVLHPRGGTVAGDLGGDLTGAGFTVRTAVLYDAEPAKALPEAGRRALDPAAEMPLDAVLLFSPRTAATFVSLVTEADLTVPCESLSALCLSPVVAEAAGALRWRRVAAAAAPDQESLLTLLVEG